MKKQNKTPGPKFCWHCGKKLRPTYAVVVDQLGHTHRVHICCSPDAVAWIRKVTAQEKMVTRTIQ